MRFLITMFVVSVMVAPGISAGELVSKEMTLIYQLEAQGQWQQAQDLASQQTNDKTLVKAHADNIGRMLSTFAAAGNYWQAGQIDEALQIVNELLAQLNNDKTTNQYLVIASKQMANELEQAKRDADQQKANDTASQGYALLKTGDYEGAIKLFDKANGLATGSVNSAARSQAEKGKLRNAALLEQAKQPTVGEQIVETLSTAVTTLFAWLVYFAVVVGAFFLARWLRSTYLVRPGTGITLEDQSVTVEQREVKSQQLSQDMAQAIVNLASGSPSASGGLMDLDATNLPNARDPLGGIAAITSHIDANAEPMRIGPFSFQARQLFLYLSLLFKRPYEYTLSGVLKKTNAHLILQVSKCDRNGFVVEDGLFEASCAAEDSSCYETLIKDVAIQIAVVLPGSKVTNDWRSMRSYLQAESLMGREASGEERKVGYKQAKVLLQTALSHDPANWMARFKLASVLRLLGDNEAARDQFDYVERMLGSQEIWCFHHFGAFLQDSPEFPWIVRYNLIVSMSKMASERAVSRALILIDQLVTELEMIVASAQLLPPQTQLATKSNDRVIRELQTRWRDIMAKLHEQKIPLSSQCQDNLLYLIKGGRAAVLCSEIERLRETAFSYPNKVQSLHHDMAEVLKRIHDDEQWLWKMTPHVKSECWQTFAQAHAAAQNAYGRACYVMNKFDDATKYLRWAIQIHVPQNFPEPHINLAAVYLKQRNRFCPDWAERARAHLEMALAMSPYNQKARYLLGKVFANASVADYDKALEEFRKAGDSDSLSLYQRGIIQLQHKQDIVKAVDLLRRSVGFATRTDFRYKEYLYAVLVLTEKGQIDKSHLREQLSHASNVATQLEKRGVTDKLKEIGALMKIKIAIQQTELEQEQVKKQDAA